MCERMKKMQNIEIAQNKLKQYNQEDVLNVLNDLNGKEKEELINQILILLKNIFLL